MKIYYNTIVNISKNISYILYCNIIDFILYTKYFVYFNYFLFVLYINLSVYYLTSNLNNKYCILALYHSINLNGCVLIKIVQWVISNLELLNITEYYYINNLLSKFYENCNIHNLNYTKKLYKQEFDNEIDKIIEFDNTVDIKSGSIAQVYKGKFIANNKEIALKIVHPEVKYQMYFPIKFLEFHKFIINKFTFLKKYDTIFRFDSFLKNVILQVNMNNEYKNMLYFYNKYKNNSYIIIPKPIYSSKNILIMDYIKAYNFEKIDIPELDKQKIIVLLNLFVKHNFLFMNYFHSDLHISNWKVRKYKDFYQLVIYDFGYVLKNNVQDIYKNFMYYTDVNNTIGIANLIYQHINDINISKDKFINDFTSIFYNISLFSDDFFTTIYKYCYKNNFILKDIIFEIFITIMIFRKNVIKYMKFNVLYDDIQSNTHINTVLELYIYYSNFCKKYDIFHELCEFIKDTYIQNDYIIKKYWYVNNNFDKILDNSDNGIDI